MSINTFFAYAFESSRLSHDAPSSIQTFVDMKPKRGEKALEPVLINILWRGMDFETAEACCRERYPDATYQGLLTPKGRLYIPDMDHTLDILGTPIDLSSFMDGAIRRNPTPRGVIWLGSPPSPTSPDGPNNEKPQGPADVVAATRLWMTRPVEVYDNARPHGASAPPEPMRNIVDLFGTNAIRATRTTPYSPLLNEQIDCFRACLGQVFEASYDLKMAYNSYPSESHALNRRIRDAMVRAISCVHYMSGKKPTSKIETSNRHITAVFSQYELAAFHSEALRLIRFELGTAKDTPVPHLINIITELVASPHCADKDRQSLSDLRKHSDDWPKTRQRDRENGLTDAYRDTGAVVPLFPVQRALDP